MKLESPWDKGGGLLVPRNLLPVVNGIEPTVHRGCRPSGGRGVDHSARMVHSRFFLYLCVLLFWS